uniref:Uncharacterized protein n=1 Tax=Anopheles farauti TaxID=69004 RepID=A0A182QV76_9DIPT
MAKAESIHNGLKTDATDDVEKSLELLDKVLSEFEEEPDRTNHHHNHHHHHPAVEPDSPSQGHQSEDDGYMSMNGRSPYWDKKPCIDFVAIIRAVPGEDLLIRDKN